LHALLLRTRRMVPRNFGLNRCERPVTVRRCAGTVAGEIQGSISVTAGDVCSRDGGRPHTDYTKQVLEYRIEVNYLTYSLHELRSDVTVSECGGGRRRRRGTDDVIISVTIAGVYESVALNTRCDPLYTACGGAIELGLCHRKYHKSVCLRLAQSPLFSYQITSNHQPTS